MGLFREGTGFREPVPEGGSRSGSGVLKVVPGFEGFGVPGFDGFLMGSEGLDFGFRWGSEGSRDQELQKTCRTNAAGCGWHNAAGNAVRRVKKVKPPCCWGYYLRLFFPVTPPPKKKLTCPLKKGPSTKIWKFIFHGFSEVIFVFVGVFSDWFVGLATLEGLSLFTFGHGPPFRALRLGNPGCWTQKMGSI